MTFDYPGYDLKFVQREQCNDSTAHLASYIFKFYSPITRYNYIVRAEHHETDIFSIKFYCKKDRSSDHKYSIIINKGDLGNIIMTCAKVIPILLIQFPNSSFAFAAARSFDKKSKTMEPLYCTQRYRLYCGMVPHKFGDKTFSHHRNDVISSYLLHNRNSEFSLNEILEMFKKTYNETDLA